MTIHSILLQPSAEYRERLLGDKFPGSSPPKVWRHNCFDRFEWVKADTVEGHTCCIDTVALVLAWREQVMREGRDMALYVLAESFGTVATMRCPDLSVFAYSNTYCIETFEGYRTEICKVDRWIDGLPVPLNQAGWVGTVCQSRGLGRCILLDENGAEIKMENT